MTSLVKKREKKSSGNRNPSIITTWLPLVFSTLSLLTSVISLLQSHASQKVIQDEILRDRQALVNLAYYVSANPELLSATDRTRLAGAGVGSVFIVKNDFWRSRAFSKEGKLDYVFMVACNRGPGIARDFTFDVTFFPKSTTSATVISVTQDQLPSTLYPRDCLALLVDAVSEYDETQGLESQTTLAWKDIRINVSYQDTLDYEYEINDSLLSGYAISLTK